MMPFPQCPICGSKIVAKEAEKILRRGNHTAVIRVPAEVCLKCGERLYSRETVLRFEQIRAKLEREETSEFQHSSRRDSIVALVLSPIPRKWLS